MSGGDELRAQVGAARRRQALRWALVLAAVLGLLSIASGGLFLYAAAVVGLLFVLSALQAALALRRIEVERKLSATEVTAGEAVEAWLIVHNRKQLPAPGLFWRDQVEPGLDVEGPTSCFTSLAGDARHRLAYRLHGLRRGLFRVGPAIVEASGPFGLVRRFLLGGGARFVTVLPRSLAIGQGWPLGHRPIHEVPRRRSLFEDPSRFQGLRDYRPGDSLRRVHWRATARSGRLQVKLFEPAVLEGVMLAVEMGQGAYGDRDVEELAVTAAASVAELVLAGGQRAGLISNGADAAEGYAADWAGGTFRRLDEALSSAAARRRITGFQPIEAVPARGRWQLERLRLLLARLVPAPGPELPALLTAELPRLPRSLVLMIVTPRLDGRLAGAAAALKRAGIELAVVWIGAGGDAGLAPAAALEGVPVYAVAREEDLETLGAQRL